MKVVTYSHARDALKSILDAVVQDADVTIISPAMQKVMQW
jgi:antitoxin YefM